MSGVRRAMGRMGDVETQSQQTKAEKTDWKPHADDDEDERRHLVCRTDDMLRRFGEGLGDS